MEGNLVSFHLLASLLKGKKKLRVDVKATGCHFPLNSTKHMGAALHLSQIVKIFFFFLRNQNFLRMVPNVPDFPEQ